MLIAPFFRSNTDINVDFYKSEDGINFDKIGTPFKGRDGSLIYYNNQYLVLTTDYVPNDYDMAVMSSNDFKTWKWNAVRCGLCTTNNNKVWASEWFLDEDKLYIITSRRQPKDTKDIDGNIIPNFRPYIIPVESTNPIKLGTPRMLNLENANKIDGQIIKHNNIYYLFIKNEYNKNTEMWTSKDLVSWKKERNYIVHDGERIEGVCCVKHDSKFYLYGDKFQSGTGIHYSVSNDLKTFTGWKPINTDGNKTRHGSVCKIKDEKALKTMGISIKPVQKEENKMIKIIGLRYGHSVNCRGARGRIDEVDSCKILYNKVKALLESLGYIVVDCNSNANNVNGELNEGTNKANKNKVDIYITLHMNSFNKSARGTECWCYDTNSKTAISIATKICTNISKLGTPNRGVKYNKGYHDLNSSNMQSIIVESIFCDNDKDVEIFNKKTDELARAIANGIDSRVSLNAPIKKPSKPTNKPITKEVYRIRKSWKDADSQKGAYSVLNNAKTECDKHKGYFVFDSKGNVVYPKARPIEYTHRNIIVYNNGAEADRICAEYFAMILNSKGEDCEVLDYNTYKLGKKTGRSIFAVGGSLEGKFKYDKLFSGKTRYETAYDVLQHLKSKY